MREQDSGIGALTRKLDRLEAREAIRDRIYAYARALDRLDRQLLEAQFWPDATVDYGVFYKGSAPGFVEVALRFQGSMRDTHHLVGNILAEVAGDLAAVESYVHAQHVIETPDGLVQLSVGARYLDRFQRRSDEWRLSFRTEVLDWGRWLPISEPWFDANREMPKGVRGDADPSYRYLLGRKPGP